MRKFVALCALMLGGLVAPQSAMAAPIDTNQCAFGAIDDCDIFADYDTGTSTQATLGGYLPGYVILLRADATLDDFTADDAAHILVIHDNFLQLFSNIAASLVFDTEFLAARNADPIDQTAITSGQTAGCPVPSGVTQIKPGVGYCFTDSVVSLFPATTYGGDVLRIHTQFPSDVDGPAPVPEPGTLTLLGFGGSAAAAAIRRRRAAKTS